MAVVIVTLKVMPEDPEVSLEKVKEASEKAITDFGGIVKGTEEEPVGFGLKALIIKFSVDESKGSPDPVAEEIEKIEGIRSAQVTMVSRALG